MSQVRGPGRTDTVLVVDDEPDSLRVITTVLESAEILVLIATSGAAALDLLGHIVPDLILMDAVMPGIDGFETTVRIKANPALAAIPVIFMTGLTESEHVVEAFEVGGADYVRKPVDHMELLARVRVHMAQGRAMQASVASLDATGRRSRGGRLDGRQAIDSSQRTGTGSLYPQGRRQAGCDRRSRGLG